MKLNNHEIRETSNHVNDMGDSQRESNCNNKQTFPLDDQDINNFNRFGRSGTPGKVGYYLRNSNSYEQLTDFIIVFTNQILRPSNGESISNFEVTIILSDGTERKYSNFRADHLTNFQELNKFLINNCGTKFRIFGKNKDILDAILETNRDVKESIAVENGYTKNLKEYNTKSLTITIDSIAKRNNPILNEYSHDINNLDFEICDIEEVEEIKSDIINNFFTLDDTIRTVTLLNFTFMPLILPFIEKSIQKKPYLMLKGPSGCGKTTLAMIVQNFYGDFPIPFSWTSTATAIEVTGNSFKDSLFVVDDFKLQNFRNVGDINRAEMLLQNYADSTSRSRASSKLVIQSSKTINGILVISAEDLVISEASTIARGIIVDMENKEPNFEAIQKVNESAKRFKKLTPHFIQFIMKVASKTDLNSLYKKYYLELDTIMKNQNIKGNNIPRLTENFTLLCLTTKLLFNFLYYSYEETEVKHLLNAYFPKILFLLKQNYERIQNFNPEEKFISNLWNLINDGTLYLHNIDYGSNSLMHKTVGYYEQDHSGSIITLAINVPRAYKMINSYLFENGGIGCGLDSLKTRLYQMGYLHSIDKDASVHFSKKDDKDRKQRGAKWLGPIPTDLDI